VGLCADVDGVEERGDEGAGCLVASVVGVSCGSNRLLRGWGYVHAGSSRTGRGRNRRLRSQGYVHAGSFRPKQAFHSVCLTMQDRNPTPRARWAPTPSLARFPPRTDRNPTPRPERSPNSVVGAGFPHEQNARRQCEPRGPPTPSLARVSPRAERTPTTPAQEVPQLRRRSRPDANPAAREVRPLCGARRPLTR
jgi:hypothetical protein